MQTFIKYAISGGLATIVHFLILITLVEVFAIDATLASAIGFCMAVVVNYNLQYHWTFKSTGSHKTIFTRYVFITFFMLGVNTLIFWVLYGLQGLSYILAQAIATAVVMFMNFTINKKYTFASTETTATVINSEE